MQEEKKDGESKENYEKIVEIGSRAKRRILYTGWRLGLGLDDIPVISVFFNIVELEVTRV